MRVLEFSPEENSSYISFVWRDELDYNQNAKDFEKSIGKYKVLEKRVNQWPGTMLLEDSATLKIYKLCDEIIKVLYCVDYVTEFLSPNYPEDLAIYDENNNILYASCSHEGLEWYGSDGF